MKLHQITSIITEEHELDYTGLDPDIVTRIQVYKPHIQQWIIQEIKKGEHPISVIDAAEYYISKITDNRYQQILSKITPSPKNILTLTLDNIKQSQSEYDGKYAKISKRKTKELSKSKYVTTLVDNAKIKILKFEKLDKTISAAELLSTYARDTKWCVTDVETGDGYLSEGPLYLIFIDGEKKYLYEPNQLMNTQDQPVLLDNRETSLISPYIEAIVEYSQEAVINGTATNSPEKAYNYARVILGGRWPEAEPTIMKDPQSAFYYAYEVIGGRWPEAEPTIMKDPLRAYYYAYEVIGGRWPEAEPIIIKGPWCAYHYAKDVIRGRWPEAEPTIMKEPVSAFYYAKYFKL